MTKYILNKGTLALLMLFIFLQTGISQKIAVRNSVNTRTSEKNTEKTIQTKSPLPANNSNFELTAPKSICDTFNYYEYQNIWTVSDYYTGSTVGADGWVNGVNVYEDEAKANYFSNTSYYPYVLGVYIAFGKAWTANPQKTISVNLYSNTGSGPGNAIASKSITMQEVMNDVNGNYLTKVMFNAPVAISGSFYAGVDFSNLTWAGVYDTLSIQSNSNGETVPSAVWEKQSDGLWYQYNTTYSYALNISLAVFPIVTDSPSDAVINQSTSSTCPGFNVNYNASSSVQNSVLWKFQNGTPASSTSVTPTVTYSSPGTWSVKLYVWGGACNNIDSAQSQITILPAPIPAVTATPASICSGDTSTLTASNGIYYSWAGFPPGQNPIQVTPITNTTYTVSVTGSNSCTAAAQVYLPVNPLPVPSASANPSLICYGENSLVTAAPGYNSYIWSNGNTNAAFSVTPVSDTTFYVTVYDSHGCKNTDSVDIIVNSCVGINETLINNEDFYIYYNPGNGTFYINNNATFEHIYINIYNISGSLIMQDNFICSSNKQTAGINSRNLSKGVYYAEIKSSKVHFIKKLIIY